MDYLTYKLIIGDDPGAKIFLKISKFLESIHEIDPTYMGPTHFWKFCQLGDFDQQPHIIKWEIWSNWNLKRNNDEFNKGIFIGATCGLLIFKNQDNDSFLNLQRIIDTFVEKQKSPISPFFVIALNDANSAQISDEQKFYIELKGGFLLPMAEEVFDQDLQPLLLKIFKILLQRLNPQICRSQNIQAHFWPLSLDELQDILLKERLGVHIIPRHLRDLIFEDVIPEKIEQLATTSASPDYEIRKLTIDDLTEEERKFVAISPEGEIIPIERELTQEEIMDMISKGFKLPDWIVIPRHCPKCFNQNQRMIREVLDKDTILMQNPTIYGKKYVCGNCGNTWT